MDMYFSQTKYEEYWQSEQNWQDELQITGKVCGLDTCSTHIAMR